LSGVSERVFSRGGLFPQISVDDWPLPGGAPVSPLTAEQPGGPSPSCKLSLMAKDRNGFLARQRARPLIHSWGLGKGLGEKLASRREDRETWGVSEGRALKEGKKLSGVHSHRGEN